MSEIWVGEPPAWVDQERWQERALREREAHLVIYRVQCAAFPNGCMSFLAWEGERNVDIYHLDRLVEPDRRAVRLLALNGWQLDHGQWICGHHDRAAGQSSPSPA